MGASQSHNPAADAGVDKFHIALAKADNLSDKGDLEGAEACYKEALRLNPKSANAHTNLGMVKKARGDLDGAEACYKEALDLKVLKPINHGKLLGNIGNIKKARGDLDGAVACYREALCLNPCDGICHRNLGHVKKSKGDSDEAEACYKEALRLDPEDAYAHCHIAELLMAKYNHAEAMESVNKAIATDRRALFFETRGRILQDQERFEDSLFDYNEALKLCPGQPVYLQRRAALFGRLSIKAKHEGLTAKSHEFAKNADEDLAAAHSSTYPGWMVEAYTLGPPPDKFNMKYSPFLQRYRIAEIPNSIQELKNYIRELLRVLGIPDADPFADRLSREVDQHPGDSVAEAAGRCWTSFQRNEQDRELCSFISEGVRFNPESIQNDIAKAAAVAPICRAINENLTIARKGTAVFPTSGKTLRGSTLPNHLVGWFLAHRGKEIRVPNYLATADEDDPVISYGFMSMSRSPHPRCLWEIQFDPRGNPAHPDYHLKYACKNVNLIDKKVDGLPDEHEFLFVAYSVFSIKDVILSLTPTADTPHRIVLEAASDNREGREDLPLAPWA